MVIKNANFEKNFNTHNHNMDPEMTVVIAEAVMLTPIIIRALRVFSPRDFANSLGASVYAFAKCTQ